VGRGEVVAEGYIEPGEVAEAYIEPGVRLPEGRLE